MCVVEQASTRQRILDTSARLFSERGYSGTSIRDIAAELGIANPSLYHHFASKQEILDELMVVPQERMMAAISQKQSGDIEQDATALVAALLDVLEPYGGIALTAARDRKLSADLEAAVTDADKAVRHAVQQLAADDFPELRSVMAISAVQGAVQDLVQQAASNDEFMALLAVHKPAIVSLAVQVLRH
jgi:AcrR family transcriptional regulator